MDKKRGEKVKNVFFCPRSGYKNCPCKGEGVKNVHVVLNDPLWTCPVQDFVLDEWVEVNSDTKFQFGTKISNLLRGIIVNWSGAV